MNKHSKDILDKIALVKPTLNSIFSKYGVINPRIFGSVAHGTATATSDIDILVDGYNKMGLLGLMKLRHELETAIGTKVDIIESYQIKPSRKPFILNSQMLAI